MSNLLNQKPFVSYVRTKQDKLNSIPLVDGQCIIVLDSAELDNRFYTDAYDSDTDSVIRYRVDSTLDAAYNITFSVDFTTGDLIYNNNQTYTFSINETTGNLEWEVAA